MPANRTGGFDLVIEFDQFFMTQAARLTLSLAQADTPFGTDPTKDIVGTATISPTLAYIWFDEEPNSAGSLHRRRATTDVISMVLNLGTGSLKVKSYALNGQAVEVPTDICEIPLGGFIEVTDRVEARQLNAVLDRPKPDETTLSLGALIDFTLDPNTASEAGGPDPKIDVRLDEALILSAPLIWLWLMKADVSGYTRSDDTYIPPGPPALVACRQETLDLIRLGIRDAVYATLSEVVDWRLNRKGLMPLQILPISTDGSAVGPTALTVRTIGTSMLLLFETTGRSGNAAAITSSQLYSGQAMALTIPNQTLIGGVVRDALKQSFDGLTDAAFVADQPCLLAQRTTVIPKPSEKVPNPSPFVLTSLVAGVDESEQIHIVGSLEQSGLGGAYTATASFDVALALSAEISVVKGIPQLIITPLPGESKVTDSDIAIAWWAYALAGVLIPIVGAIIAGIVDAFGGGLVVGPVRDALAEAELATAGLPMSAGGMNLSVQSTSMNQVDAPRRTIDFGWFSLPSPFRDHDLVIRLSAKSLPTLPNTLTISCQVPDAEDADRRIDAVGGWLADGTRWGMSIDDAVAVIQGGQISMIVGSPPNQADVEVATSVRGLPYLRTKPSPGPNLEDLPECPG